ncbi:unnamed protein product [Closterium sp. Yama58-4]|nr:unnamed protein product [Closterium sp. Yama58-4]
MSKSVFESLMQALKNKICLQESSRGRREPPCQPLLDATQKHSLPPLHPHQPEDASATVQLALRLHPISPSGTASPHKAKSELQLSDWYSSSHLHFFGLPVLRANRSRALPSLPVALALPSPFPSLLLSPLPSRRSISRRSLPVPLGLSHPIPSLSLSPLPSRRSPSLPSLPVALSLSPLPSRRALSSRPSFPPGSSPISSPSLLLCNALSAPSFPPFTICLPSPHHSVLPLSPPITSFLLSSLPSRVLPLSPPITSFLLSSLPSRTLPLSLPIPSFPLSPLLSRRPPGHQSLLFAFAANQPSRRPSSFRTSFLSLF